MLVIFALFCHSPPNLQILHSVAFFVFCGALPGDDVCSQRREAELEDIGCRKRGNDLASRGVDDRNPAKMCESRRWLVTLAGLLFGRRPREVPAVRRVAAAAQVTFRSGALLAPEGIGNGYAPYRSNPGRGS